MEAHRGHRQTQDQVQLGLLYKDQMPRAKSCPGHFSWYNGKMKGTYSQQDLLEADPYLCFDDILLVPECSALNSRTDPDVSVSLSRDITLDLPIISSPMDSITRSEMLQAMSNCGGLGILSRYINVEDESARQARDIRLAKRSLGVKYVGCAIGIRNGVRDHAMRLLDEGCDVICLDAAHGDHRKMYTSIGEVKLLREHYSFALMAGNVCTPTAAVHFAEAGVDAIKVGIGPGAACTTRRVTGFGMPQLSAVLHCKAELEEQHLDAKIIADGGLRTTGDMVKALWAGADACMVVYMLAGTSATPDIGNEKAYRGMSSRTVHQRTDVAAEGIDMTMLYNGKTEIKLEEYKQGIKSGLAMAGAENIEQMRENVWCVRASNLTMQETNPLGNQ